MGGAFMTDIFVTTKSNVVYKLTGTNKDLAIYNKVSTHRFVPEVFEITKPLQKLGIGYFSYSEFDLLNNQIISLINNDRVGKYFIQNNGFQMESSLMNLHPGLYSISTLPSLNKDQISYFKKRMTVENSLDTLELVQYDNKNKKIKLYCYGISNLALYNREYLENFNFYFKDKAKSLLEESDRTTIKSIQPTFFINYENHLLLENSISNPNNIFSGDVGFFQDKLYYFTSKYNLSNRETQCLNLILQNKLNKQIASHLGLSQRTVELYILNLRKKLNCRNKMQLMIMMCKQHCRF